jgi:di/tricarboxylate transporter
VFFVLTAGISAMGSPLGGLVMAPIGMSVADKRGIDPMLMGLAMGTGLSAGAFAPTSLFGIVTYGTAHAAGIELNPLLLFAVAGLVNVVLFGCAYCIFGGLALSRQRAMAVEEMSEVGALISVGSGPDTGNAAQIATTATAYHSTDPDSSAAQRLSRVQLITVCCMSGLLVAVIALSLADRDPDIGVLAFVFGAVLTLVDPRSGNRAIAKIDWPTVLLVGGIITYAGVLDEMGAVDLLGDIAGKVGIPLIAALVICLIGGLVSAFASTTGMLAALVPLALPLVAFGDVPGWALICALGVCASIVDVSPFSTVGATYVATTVDEGQRPRMTRLLTRWGMSMVVLGPIVLVGVLVAPGVVL